MAEVYTRACPAMVTDMELSGAALSGPFSCILIKACGLLHASDGIFILSVQFKFGGP
jgi:hypothetical protein